MREVVDGETGEIREVESLNEAADQMIERPPYWRRAYSSAGKNFYVEGESGKEFEKAFLDAQKEIGPVIWADSQNDFNKSRYASLGGMLSKIMPIIHKHGISIRQGTGKINTRNDLGPAKMFLPVWLHLTHVDSLQWQCATVEIPLVKIDPQGYKATVTFGRRTVQEAYFCVAPTDEDGVLASHELTAEDLDKLADKMAENIAICQTEADLRKWHKESEQQFDMLGARVERLKEAWQSRLNELRPARKGKSQ